MPDQEIISAGAVRALIAKADRLKSFIRDGEKKPLFDGEVFVYNNPSKRNEAHLGRIHVQVRSRFVDNPFSGEAKCSIKKHELQAYLKEGGIALFFVLISRDGEMSKVFYANLLPFKIVRLINKMGSKKSKRILCLPFPTTSVDITDWALNYLEDSEKQSALIQHGHHRMLSRKELEESGQISHYEFGFTSSQFVDDPLGRLFENELYIYAVLTSGFEIPVELFAGGERVISTTIDCDVIIGGKVFFNTINLDFTNDTETVRFGKNITILSPRKNIGCGSATLKYELTGTLSEMIADAECILALGQNRRMILFDKDMSLDPGIDLSGLEVIHKQLSSYKSTLDAAGVTDELDVAMLNEDDKQWLRLFELALVKSQEIPITPSVDMRVGGVVVSTICVANLSICLLVEKTSEDRYKLHNLFNNNLDFTVSMRTDDGDIFRITQYYVLTDDLLHQISNLDLDAVYNDIVEIGNNLINIQEANKLMFRAILAFDKCEVKRCEFLDFAIRVINWTAEQEEADEQRNTIVNELNIMQITKRKRPFHQDETERLKEIIDLCFGDNSLLTGAYILLEDFATALRHFKRLDQYDKDRLINFPIMNLWPEHNRMLSELDVN